MIVDRDHVVNTCIPGYQFLSQPTLHNAGGVGFYIKNDIGFHLREDLCVTTNDFECLWVEIHRKSRNVVCAVIYRHPNGDLDKFINYFYAALDKISNESKLCSIMGDFNLNLLNFESHNPTGDFINTLTSYCFQPCIIKPTRITDHSATLIDNIFFNSIEHKIISGNLLCDLSDHLPNFMIVNELTSFTSKRVIYRRDYSTFNGERLLAEVQGINWEDKFINCQDIDSVFESFHSEITHVIDRHVPVKKLSKRESKLQAKPWVTKAIRVSIAKKRLLYKDYLRFRNDYYLAKFKYYRNKLKHLILVSKKLYYKNFFLTNNCNVKQTWKGIKQIINSKATSFNAPNILQVGSTTITDRMSIANAFNDYFSTIGQNLAVKIPSVATLFAKYMPNPLRHSFVLFPVTRIEIEELII